MKNSSDTKQQIIKAAYDRFSYFGFNKTTMAEIAEDCGMSAANIYRFFKGKEDILADIVLLMLREIETRLKKTVEDKRKTAEERLRLLMREALIINFDRYANHPKMNESLENICSKRPDLILKYREVKQKLVAILLREGINSGEFVIKDPDDRALSILHATMAFHSPFFISTYSLEELATFSDNVITALVEGLHHERVHGEH